MQRCVVRGWRSPVSHPSLRARPPQRATRVQTRRCAEMSSQGQAAGGVTRADTLITFDVDGTLIEATGPDANQFHKEAFAFAFRTVHGVEASIDELNHHGSTDRLVLAATLRHRGVAEEAIERDMDKCCAAMLHYAHAHSAEASTGIRILPGVEPLLRSLAAERRAVVGLVTGNLEPIAWLKMSALGLRPHFSSPEVGGFGSDHTERGELVRLAAERAAVTHGWAGVHWHVGDTPNDIIAAESGGARALGLTTGVFSESQLRDTAQLPSTVILDGLADVPAVLSLLLSR